LEILLLQSGISVLEKRCKYDALDHSPSLYNMSVGAILINGFKFHTHIFADCWLKGDEQANAHQVVVPFQRLIRLPPCPDPQDVRQDRQYQD